MKRFLAIAAAIAALALVAVFARRDGERVGENSPGATADPVREAVESRPDKPVRAETPDEQADAEASEQETVRADEPEAPTQEGDDETPQEKAQAAYEKSFDVWVKKQEQEGWKPAAEDIARFKAAFDTLTAEQKIDQVPHAENLFEDAAFGFLKAILMDPKEPQDVLESIYFDLLNRPEELKYPVLREVHGVKDHPLRKEIEELDEMLGDVGSEW